jgi:hypothetical protein
MEDVTGSNLSTSRADQQEEAERSAVFVIQLVETGDPLVAWMRAGLTDARWPAQVAVEKYMARPDIQAMIEVTKGLTLQVAPVKVTRDSIIAACQDVYEKALTDRQYGSALQALKLQSGLLGLLEQKISVSHSYKAEDMSDAELARIAAGDKPVIDAHYEDVSG